MSKQQNEDTSYMFSSPYSKGFPVAPKCLQSTPVPGSRNQYPYEAKSSPVAGSFSPGSRYAHDSPLSHHEDYSHHGSAFLTPEKNSLPEAYMDESLKGSPNYYTSPSRKQVSVSELENSTIQKQRKELQLLLGELQDRDRELNEMVASHQKQVLAWERDRQRLLTLEQKCTRLQSEIKLRNDQVKTMSTRLKVMQSQDESQKCALDSMQKQLKHMTEEASTSKMKMTELQEEIHQVNNLVQTLSTRAGQLEAREQELLTVIRLKDKDLTEAANHVAELTSKFKKLDLAIKESRYSSESLTKEVAEWKKRCKEAENETDNLKGKLQQQTHLTTEQKVENGKLQESLKALQQELNLAVEREKRKDQLIQLQRSKQDRTDAELTSLRQAYERQHRDLSLTQLNLESEREKSREEHKQPSTSHTSPFSSRSGSVIHIDGISPLVSPKKEEGDSLRRGGTKEETKGERFDAANDEDEDEDNDGNEEEAEVDLTKNEEDHIGGNIGEGDASPASKLHKLLSESRQMVASLERAALPPYTHMNGHAEDESLDSQKH